MGGRSSFIYIVTSSLPIQALSESDPSWTSKLEIHTAAWPLESTPILDTATTLGGKSREPNPERSFIPVGHISLDSENEDPNAADPTRGIYRISSFYVSGALQSSGLGRAAMDEIEHLAVSEPLNAKTLTLNTVANEYEGKKERWDVLISEGKQVPKVGLPLVFWERVIKADRYADQRPRLVCKEGIRSIWLY